MRNKNINESNMQDNNTVDCERRNNKVNVENDSYVVYCGICAYSVLFIFVVLFSTVCAAFWLFSINIIAFYVQVVFYSSFISILIYVFIRTKIIMHENYLDVSIGFRKRKIYRIRDLNDVSKHRGYIELYFVHFDKISMLTYMKNAKKLTQRAESILHESSIRKNDYIDIYEIGIDEYRNRLDGLISETIMTIKKSLKCNLKNDSNVIENTLNKTNEIENCNYIQFNILPLIEQIKIDIQSYLGNNDIVKDLYRGEKTILKNIYQWQKTILKKLDVIIKYVFINQINCKENELLDKLIDLSFALGEIY